MFGYGRGNRFNANKRFLPDRRQPLPKYSGIHQNKNNRYKIHPPQRYARPNFRHFHPYERSEPHNSISFHELSYQMNRNQMLENRIKNLEEIIGTRVQAAQNLPGEVAVRNCVFSEDIRDRSNATRVMCQRSYVHNQTLVRDVGPGEYFEQNRSSGNCSGTPLNYVSLKCSNNVFQSVPWNKNRSSCKNPTSLTTPESLFVPPWMTQKPASNTVFRKPSSSVFETPSQDSTQHSSLSVHEIETNEEDESMSHSCDVDIEREENAQFSKYNELGFEEDDEGRVIVYVQARCLPNYEGEMVPGLGIFFSPLHPCNLSMEATLATKEVNAQLEAAIKAIEAVWNYGNTKIAICTDSEHLLGRILLPKTIEDKEEMRIRGELVKKIEKMCKVSFVPLREKFNAPYIMEAKYLANVAAGLAPTPPPSLIQPHTCREERFSEGDVVTIKSEDVVWNCFRGLFKICLIKPIEEQSTSLFFLESLLREELTGDDKEQEAVLKEEIHLVRKNLGNVKTETIVID